MRVWTDEENKIIGSTLVLKNDMLVFVKSSKMRKVMCSCAPCSKSQTNANHLALGRTNVALRLNVLFATRLMKFGFISSPSV